jgi:hypothetical protein
MQDKPRDDKKLIQAKKIADFFIHLFWFIVINIFLYFLDYRDNGVINWAYWATFGWGIGIISHSIDTFFGSNFVEYIYKRMK